MMPEIIVFLTTGRCGSNIITKSLYEHYCNLGYTYIHAYSNYVNFDSTKVITELEKKSNSLLFTHSDIPEQCIDFIFENFKITTISLQRKDTYSWFLSNYFNSKFLDNFWNKNTPHLIYNYKEQKRFEEHIKKQNLKSNIKHIEMLGLIEIFAKFLQVKDRFFSVSTTTYELFYENLIENIENDCSRIGIKFVENGSTFKFPKPNLEQVFTNIEQSKNVWYNLLNKRLRVCGIIE